MPPLLKPYQLARWYKCFKVRSTDQCWQWTSLLDSDGYARFNIGKRGYFRANRVAWWIHHSHDPKELLVCHTCDNRKCVKPHHLFLGTVLDNGRDMAEKLRVGTLTGEDIRDIRTSSLPTENLASKYGLARGYITAIQRGERRQHVHQDLIRDRKRLGEQTIKAIRKAKGSCTEISRRFGVCKSSVHLIRTRKIYKWVA